MIRIGVDFGGTKIEAAALDGSGAVLARVRAPNPGTYDTALHMVADLVRQAESQAGAGPGTVGVGIPGSPSPRTGLIRGANSTWLNGRAFGADLEAVLSRWQAAGHPLGTELRVGEGAAALTGRFAGLAEDGIAPESADLCRRCSALLHAGGQQQRLWPGGGLC